jgi:CBS domain-containing protein
MLTVKDIMTSQVISLRPGTDIVQAAQTLLDNHINGAPVIDENGRLVGILCQSDLVAQQKKLPLPTIFTMLDGIFSFTSSKQLEKQVRKIAALTVVDAMTPSPVTVGPDDNLETVAALMVDRNFHTLPVVQEEKVVGVVGKEDLLRTLLSSKIAH